MELKIDQDFPCCPNAIVSELVNIKCNDIANIIGRSETFDTRALGQPLFALFSVTLQSQCIFQ